MIICKAQAQFKVSQAVTKLLFFLPSMLRIIILKWVPKYGVSAEEGRMGRGTKPKLSTLL
jgi:hypothetical protein